MIIRSEHEVTKWLDSFAGSYFCSFVVLVVPECLGDSKILGEKALFSIGTTCLEVVEASEK